VGLGRAGAAARGQVTSLTATAGLRMLGHFLT